MNPYVIEKLKKYCSMKGIWFALLNDFLLVPLKSIRKCNRSTLVIVFYLESTTDQTTLNYEASMGHLS